MSANESTLGNVTIFSFNSLLLFFLSGSSFVMVGVGVVVCVCGSILLLTVCSVEGENISQ